MVSNCLIKPILKVFELSKERRDQSIVIKQSTKWINMIGLFFILSFFSISYYFFIGFIDPILQSIGFAIPTYSDPVAPDLYSNPLFTGTIISFTILVLFIFIGYHQKFANWRYFELRDDKSVNIGSTLFSKEYSRISNITEIIVNFDKVGNNLRRIQEFVFSNGNKRIVLDAAPVEYLNMQLLNYITEWFDVITYRRTEENYDEDWLPPYRLYVLDDDKLTIRTEWNMFRYTVTVLRYYSIFVFGPFIPLLIIELIGFQLLYQFYTLILLLPFFYPFFVVGLIARSSHVEIKLDFSNYELKLPYEKIKLPNSTSFNRVEREFKYVIDGSTKTKTRTYLIAKSKDSDLVYIPYSVPEEMVKEIITEVNNLI